LEDFRSPRSFVAGVCGGGAWCVMRDA
jgi:hypothetical protein